MMTQDRDYEDILRRALAAAAESIEPTGDGLQRIRHRLDSRQSARSVLSECTEWLELHGTRLLVRSEPAIERGRAALKRTGLRRALPVLAGFLAGLFSPRGRAGGHRGRAGGHRGPASPPGRLGPAGAWLKPVFAVSAAVAIVVAGVVILNHETQTVISPLNSYNSSGPATSLGGGKTANSKRWKLPLGVTATQQITGPARNPKVKSVLPAVVCTPTPTPTPTPSSTTTAPVGGTTATPTPTASSATGTPATPQPTDTSLPTATPTASAATGGTATGGTAAETPAALVVPYEVGAACGASPTP